MNSTTYPQTSTGSIAPPQTKRTDSNRTHRNIRRVPSPRPCSSRLVARGGIEPPTFRFSGGSPPEQVPFALVNVLWVYLDHPERLD